MGFYPLSMKPSYEKAKSWPDDAKEVAFDIFQEYSGNPPDGKMRGVDKKGEPAWVDIPPPTHDQLVSDAEQKKQQLLSEAASKIALMQNVINPAINPNVTEEQKAQLLALQKYQVALYLIDTSKAPDIKWPEKP